METTQKLIYAPKYGFHCTDFQETHNHSVNVHVDIFRIQFHLNSRKNAQNIGKFHLQPYISLTLCGKHLDHVTKSINQYGKYEYKFDLHPHPIIIENGLPF
jgi:hypothetical protein